MQTNVVAEEDATILMLDGRLDTNNAASVEQNVFDLVEQGTQMLVFDFSQVDYISSAGLRVILKAAKQIRASGGDMAIYGMRAKVREVFEMSGFLSILTVRDNRDDAVAAISG